MKNFSKLQSKKIVFQDEEINIKQYISILEKQAFIKFVVDKYFEVIGENDDVEISDKIIYSSSIKELTYFYCIIKYFTDIEVDEGISFTELYDNIVGSGLFDPIREMLPENVINDIDIQIENAIWNINDDINKDIQKKNSLENLIERFLNKLLEKMPNDKQLSNLMNKFIKSLNSIDPEKLSYISKAIGWNNGTINKEKIK
jgi:hypothetical protein